MFRAGLMATLWGMVRARGTQFKVAVVVPLMTVLPYTIMAHGLAPNSLSTIFACNLAWAGIYFGAIEGFLAREAVLESSRLDTIRMAGDHVWLWLGGQTVAIFVVFLPSVPVSWTLAKLMADVDCGPELVLGVLAVSFVGQVGVGAAVLAVQLCRQRTFHLVNLGMDLLQTVSCVLYPLSALPLIAHLAAIASPITWGMEALRRGSIRSVGMFLVSSLFLWLAGRYLMTRALRRIARLGRLNV